MVTKKALKITAIVLCIVVITAMIPITIYSIKPSMDFKKKQNQNTLKAVSSTELGEDRIHFLSTGGSDAILLESGGKFALIDAGEDTDNPRGFEELELEGFEDKVLSYLKEHAVDKDGKIYLDFVLGTHSHSDHIGGFDTIVSDADVTVGRAYLKKYDSSKIRENEVIQWDNQEVYNQMKNALKSKNSPIISELDDTSFQLGALTITLFNTDDPETNKKVGENDQSLGVLIEKNGTRVFLSGDMDNLSGDETRLAPKIGKVDLLKIGHHSYSGSSTSKFLKELNPDFCVITNNYQSVQKSTVNNITRICDSDIYVTGKENGVVANIGDNGKIDFYNNIH